MFALAVITVLSTAVALAALVTARRARNERYAIPKARLESIETQLAELDDRVGAAVDALKTVTQRNRMRVRRKEEAASSEPVGIAQAEGETRDEWKARMRAGIASGSINPRKSISGAN